MKSNHASKSYVFYYPQERTPSGRAAFVWLMILCSILTFVTTYYSVRQGKLQELEQQANFQLQTLQNRLDLTLQQFRYLPKTLAQDPILQQFLRQPLPQYTDVINSKLKQWQISSQVQTIYLINATGKTLAASNYDEGQARSFVGKLFDWRPYFQKALTGITGEYYALGSTSQKRGYYFAHALYDQNKTLLGVVVVKTDIDLIASAWLNGAPTQQQRQYLITDPQGIIFLSSDPAWDWKLLQPLSNTALEAIYQSRRYTHYPPKSEERAKFTAFTHFQRPQMPLQSGTLWRDTDGNDYLHHMRTMELGADEHWNIHVLLSTQPIHQAVWQAMLLTTLLVTLVGLLAVTLWHNINQRRQYERQEKEQLEEKVERRTRQLRQTEAELIQAAKMAALGELASGINHELNNPLAAIRAYADNAEQFLQLGNSQQAQANLTEIGKLTERMATITRQLKSFSRKSQGNISPCNVQQALESALMLLHQKSQQSQVTLTHECTMQHQVMADSVWLEQILINLITNAIEAAQSQAPGCVDIHCQTQSDSQLQIQVRDNGPGLSEQALQHWSEAFFTTKAIGQGLGLGLSISYRLAKDMQGELKAENHAEGGAQFTLSLPMTEASVTTNT